jgi:hypothetical protein
MKATTSRSAKSTKKELSPEQRAQLLRALKARFEKNMNRHEGLAWAQVQTRLEASAEKLWSLNEMERTGGEPDVVGHDATTGEYLFCDCSAESPKGRRSLCYDREALESRKEHKPENNALDVAAGMGIELLTRRPVLRSPLRHCFRVSQRRGILLCRQGVPWVAPGLSTIPFTLDSSVFGAALASARNTE